MGAGLLHRPPRGRPAGGSDHLRLGGIGGSYAYADTATGVAFALTKNRLTQGFDAAEEVAEVVREALTET